MRKANGWAIKLDGRILPSWVHVDKAVLDSNAKSWPAEHIKRSIEVVPVEIRQIRLDFPRRKRR